MYFYYYTYFSTEHLLSENSKIQFPNHCAGGPPEWPVQIIVDGVGGDGEEEKPAAQRFSIQERIDLFESIIEWLRYTES